MIPRTNSWFPDPPDCSPGPGRLCHDLPIPLSFAVRLLGPLFRHAPLYHSGSDSAFTFSWSFLDLSVAIESPHPFIARRDT